MRRHVLAIYVAVEGAGVGAAIGPAVFPGPCARPCSLIFVAPILVAISDAVIAIGAVIIAWQARGRGVAIDRTVALSSIPTNAAPIRITAATQVGQHGIDLNGHTWSKRYVCQEKL